MTPVRLRHPKGVTTLQVDFSNATVLDLQQQIFAATEIPPSQQERTSNNFYRHSYHSDSMFASTVKAGYPPYPLTLVPELPIDSLGLQSGEQLVVTQRAGSSQDAFRPARVSPFPAPSPVAAMTGKTASQVRQTPAWTPSSSPPKGPDYVLTSNGYMIHRVCCLFILFFSEDASGANAC